MFSAARAGAARWLRIVLAVVALVATHASVVRAAFVTTCARALSPSMSAVVRGDASVASGVAAHATALDVPHDDSGHAPAQRAAVPQCATTVGVLAAVVDVPGGLAVWDTASPLPTSESRPPSIAPAPPFRPPRAN